MVFEALPMAFKAILKNIQKSKISWLCAKDTNINIWVTF